MIDVMTIITNWLANMNRYDYCSRHVIDWLTHVNDYNDYWIMLNESETWKNEAVEYPCYKLNGQVIFVNLNRYFLKNENTWNWILYDDIF